MDHHNNKFRIPKRGIFINIVNGPSMIFLSTFASWETENLDILRKYFLKTIKASRPSYHFLVNIFPVSIRASIRGFLRILFGSCKSPKDGFKKKMEDHRSLKSWFLSTNFERCCYHQKLFTIKVLKINF